MAPPVREVETNTRVYTLYSSEFQQRMRVYFALRAQLDECLALCPVGADSRRRCEEDCERVLDGYAERLAPEYAGRTAALDEVVRDSPTFDVRAKPQPGLWGLFGRAGGA